MSRKFVPITKEDLLAKVDALYDKTRDAYDRAENPDQESLLDSFTPPGSLSPRIEEDLAKVEFDCENVAYDRRESGPGLSRLVGLHVLPNGMPYVGVTCGGDWEEPVFMILYWDGRQVRGYIPKDGNCWNHNTKTAIGNDEEADAKFLKRYIREHGVSRRTGQKPTVQELEDFDEEVKDLGAQELAGRIYSPELVLADIQARILPADPTVDAEVDFQQPNYDQPRSIYAEDERGEVTKQMLATIVKADAKCAQKVLSAPVQKDGRSPWLWVRLQNGDMLLGTFPHGETYEETELDPNRP